MIFEFGGMITRIRSCRHTIRGPNSSIYFFQASRFQIIKVHGERTALTDDKEGIEEMELAATSTNSLESWLSTIEVSFFDFFGELRCCG